ncbi:Response regulator receiver domain-containing protein [Bryocella elongata]|uniref:Response regulator receiver domain-containing protein n=1 Tax=Bryocella elongata TaxID=863522 RepID=A0A1H6BL35_9BACT|nr:response regulator [Bryocella elongata]SEG61175.1 Response regulator receiver domain-containing protein [Bryocella elongata]
MLESTKTQLLLVDDDDELRAAVGVMLERSGFKVRAASNVNDALKLIGSDHFDVLVSDLHMPGQGDGLTVVSAMRHANPRAITIILSAHPEMKAAAAAILSQTDDILVKPTTAGALVALIRDKMKAVPATPRITASLATILEEETLRTISDWLVRVDNDRLVLSVDLDDSARCAHLPQLFADLVHRLRQPLPLGSRALVSPAAVEHGSSRRRQGYTAAMMVEESRMLQVSIFQTLQNNLHRVNFSLLLVGVMAIADEVDSQLAQAMAAYVKEEEVDARPLVA